MVLVKVWSHPLLVHHCLSSGFSCKLTSCQNCVRSPPPLHSFSPHPTPRQALGLLPFFLPQHEILGKFQILGVIVSIISEPKGGAHNPLWIPVLHICSLLWLREPSLEQPYFLLRCRPHLQFPASVWASGSFLLPHQAEPGLAGRQSSSSFLSAWVSQSVQQGQLLPTVSEDWVGTCEVPIWFLLGQCGLCK